MPSSLIPSSGGKGKKAPPPPMDLGSDDSKKGGNIPEGFLSTQNIIIMVSSLAVVALAYGGAYFWESSTQNSITTAQMEQEEAIERLQDEEMEEARIFAEKSAAVIDVVSSQKRISSIFELMEDSIHPDVVVNEFNVDLEENTAFVSGLTDVEEGGRYVALSEQHKIWEEDADFIQVFTMEDFNIDPDGYIEFSASFTVSPFIFTEHRISAPSQLPQDADDDDNEN